MTKKLRATTRNTFKGKPRIAVLGTASILSVLLAPACASENLDEPESLQSGDALATETSNCATLTGTTGSIIDSAGATWTLAGTAGNFVVHKNGVAAGYSASVTKLFYSSHVIYQSNAAGGWWSWTAGTWAAVSDPIGTCHAASASGTTIPPAARIYDNGGDTWTVNGGVVYDNGATAGFSAGVSTLLWFNGTIYQQNTAGNWWSWAAASKTWVVATGDPRGTVVPTPPTATGCLPFTMPSQAALFGSSKKVFAHYFYPYPLSLDNKPASSDYYNVNYLSPSGESNKFKGNGGLLRSRPLPTAVSASASWKVENMKKEIKQAIAAGITGFTVDALGASQANAGSQMQDLYTAAAAVDSRFKIVVMPDISALGSDAAGADAVETIVTSIANNPAAYKLTDGRLVVSPFYANKGTVAWWKSILDALSAKGIKVAFVPVFLGFTQSKDAFAPISYGMSDWGTATPGASASMQTWPATAHALGKIFMSPISVQQYRPKSFLFWEAGNSAAFRSSWTSAIAGGADWVQVVTWGDHSEASAVEPYTDATLQGDVGTGFYNLNAYYASWFLTGAAPKITQDVLYYFYRREPTNATASAQTSSTNVVGAAGENNIELVAFLTTPGTIGINVGGKATTMNAPAGVTSFKVPLVAGTPKFTLARNNTSVISFDGGVQIYGTSGLPSGTLDLTYWSGSASTSGTCALAVP